MQDGDATDTARSQKRETPEDTDTAQEPERRVRPRETPVGAASAAAPGPEEEVENAPAKAESNNGDAVEDKDGEDGDTVATAPPAQPRTRVWYSRVRGLTDAERAVQSRVNNPFDQPLRGQLAPVTPFDDAPRIGRPAAPARWVREEVEVETGRVVSQEPIEGEPPQH